MLLMEYRERCGIEVAILVSSNWGKGEYKKNEKKMN